MPSLPRRKFLTSAAVAASALSIGPRHARATRALPEKIKIGQIGTGHAHASGVFSQLRQVSDDFEIVGVVENNPERRQTLAGQYQGVSIISEEQLLNTPGLQAVVVETEVADLLPTARRCVDAGMNIHLDKPAGESFSAFASLLDEVKRRQLHLQMGYIYRYNPAFQFCYRIVEEGWLGDIFEIHAVMSKKVGADSRQRLAQFVGGSMFEIGCHVIDATLRVLGPPNQTTPYGRQTHPQQDTLVDNQVAVLDYPRALATIRSSLIEYEGFARRQFRVCGEYGVFDLRPLGSTTFQLALERPQEGYKTGYQDITLKEGPGIFNSAFRDLAAILRGEKENDYPLEHELAVHKTILGASGYPLD